jgi:hypothetical protein
MNCLGIMRVEYIEGLVTPNFSLQLFNVFLIVHLQLNGTKLSIKHTTKFGVKIGRADPPCTRVF